MAAREKKHIGPLKPGSRGTRVPVGKPRGGPVGTPVRPGSSGGKPPQAAVKDPNASVSSPSAMPQPGKISMLPMPTPVNPGRERALEVAGKMLPPWATKAGLDANGYLDHLAKNPNAPGRAILSKKLGGQDPFSGGPPSGGIFAGGSGPDNPGFGGPAPGWNPGAEAGKADIVDPRMMAMGTSDLDGSVDSGSLGSMGAGPAPIRAQPMPIRPLPAMPPATNPGGPMGGATERLRAGSTLDPNADTPMGPRPPRPVGPAPIRPAPGGGMAGGNMGSAGGAAPMGPMTPRPRGPMATPPAVNPGVIGAGNKPMRVGPAPPNAGPRPFGPPPDGPAPPVIDDGPGFQDGNGLADMMGGTDPNLLRQKMAMLMGGGGGKGGGGGPYAF